MYAPLGTEQRSRSWVHRNRHGALWGDASGLQLLTRHSMGLLEASYSDPFL